MTQAVNQLHLLHLELRGGFHRCLSQWQAGPSLAAAFSSTDYVHLYIALNFL